MRQPEYRLLCLLSGLLPKHPYHSETSLSWNWQNFRTQGLHLLFQERKTFNYLRGRLKLCIKKNVSHSCHKIDKNLLGTPDTSRRGRNTRKALRAFTSKPPDLPPEWLSPSASLVNCSKITLNNLEKNREEILSSFTYQDIRFFFLLLQWGQFWDQNQLPLSICAIQRPLVCTVWFRHLWKNVLV